MDPLQAAAAAAGGAGTLLWLSALIKGSRTQIKVSVSLNVTPSRRGKS
jgi:hypothetical protein